MRFACIAFAVTCFNIFEFFVKADVHHEKSKEEENEAENIKNGNHTFVALLDIVFTDRSKRSCTGAIIHDNVVITAAHCFIHVNDENIQPELTTSFVVIGSKKMFDSGYEQYLPIERILMHPAFATGWTADLALVYTFAGMTSDKPGKVIPLAGEKMNNPVDAHVTILSWGREDGKAAQNWNQKKNTKPICYDASEDDNKCEEHKVTVGFGVDSKRSRGQPVQPQVQIGQPLKRHPPASRMSLRQQHRFQTQYRKRKGLQYEYPLLQQKFRNQQSEELTVRRVRLTTKKVQSRYLTSKVDNEEQDYLQNDHQYSHNLTYKPKSAQAKLVTYIKNIQPEEKQVRNHVPIHGFLEPSNTIKNNHRNWRRSMGASENKLTVEIFGFMNLATCKKIVEAALPPLYEIKNGEVTCYSSEEHYITDEDAGAPAIRHGQLVAVTVGGAQCEGDHVGVGVKMSCYCSWIVENLPGNKENIKCCKNCCDVKKQDELTRVK